MIDIDAPEARAKLATLPHELDNEIEVLRMRAEYLAKVAKRQRRRCDEGRGSDHVAREAELCARMFECALNAAIVAAFEPLTAPDQSSDVARILGGDV